MGVNTIVMIENSKRVTRQAFVPRMERDGWREAKAYPVAKRGLVF